MKPKELALLAPAIVAFAPAIAVGAFVGLALFALFDPSQSDPEPTGPVPPPTPVPIPTPQVLPAPARAVAALPSEERPTVPPRSAPTVAETKVAPTAPRGISPLPITPPARTPGPAPAVPAARKPRAGKRLTAADISGAFAGIPLTRSAAVARIRNLTGCGQTAAYTALAQGGPFSDRLHEDDEGRLCWKAA